MVDEATARDFTAARSVSAVMHGRLEAAGYRMGQPEPQAAPGAPEPEAAPDAGEPAAGSAAPGRLEPVSWAERVPEVIRPEARQLGLELGAALDARAEELGHAQAESPEAWVLRTLGPFPANGSPALQADWLGRAGRAASYREAAGITQPGHAHGASAPGTPRAGRLARPDAP